MITDEEQRIKVHKQRKQRIMIERILGIGMIVIIILVLVFLVYFGISCSNLILTHF